MFCNKCGAQLPDSSIFCSQCGNTISNTKDILQNATISKRSSLHNNKTNLLWLILPIAIVITIVVCVSVIKDSETTPDVVEMKDRNETKDVIEQDVSEIQEVNENEAEDSLNDDESVSIYGKWIDSSGVISFTFQDNGIVRISGLSDILGADLFTFTEIDNDTFQLKADSDNVLLNLISFNLDYRIYGDVMAVNIAGEMYQLMRQE